MPILDSTQTLPVVFEPILQHRFIMIIDGIPAYQIKTVDGIGWEDSSVDIHYINSYFSLRSKRKYSDITLSLYDPVAPSGAQAVEQWGLLSYELLSARGGYQDFYTKDINLQILGPADDIVREWVIKRAFPLTVKYGSYDYSGEAYTTIDLTLKHSGLVLNY